METKTGEDITSKVGRSHPSIQNGSGHVLTLLVVSLKADYRFLSYYTQLISTKCAFRNRKFAMDVAAPLLKLCPLLFYSYIA